MTQSPYFGIMLTLCTYLIGMKIKKKMPHPLVNPLLISILLSIALLKIFQIPYAHYAIGGQYITFFIGPATVALVIPLYHNMEKLRENILPVLGGTLVGAFTALVSIFFLSRLFGLTEFISISVMPQSITTAIAMPLAEEYGGSGSIAALSVIIRGISGAVIGPAVLQMFKIHSPIAKGVAMGTTSHAVGTSRALELGEVEGGMSGLSVALAGIITVFLLPLFELLY
ncbi:MAG: LrgB family protein [Tissierellia bacterium]|nr:LrgB family protein [Tissierellia bacterium]